MRQSTSSLDSSVANAQCTGMHHPLVYPATCQGDHRFPADVRAGSARPAAEAEGVYDSTDTLRIHLSHADRERLSAPTDGNMDPFVESVTQRSHDDMIGRPPVCV